jgi:hypothetical protein
LGGAVSAQENIGIVVLALGTRRSPPRVTPNSRLNPHRQAIGKLGPAICPGPDCAQTSRVECVKRDILAEWRMAWELPQW